MKKAMAVIGTRPDAIKMAPVILALKKSGIQTVVVATAQHREMLDQVLKIFGITPDYDLNIMQSGQTLEALTARILTAITECIDREKPDIVIVQGDTTSSYVAAISAFYHKIPVAHVEAGLRTSDKYQPFPEEINRRFVSVIADLHFAPTQTAVDNLLRENVSRSCIHMVGNTVIDALLFAAKKDCHLSQLDLPELKFKQRMILVTAHRRENWGEPMEEICQSLKQIVQEFSDVSIVFSMHKNPIVRDTIQSILGGLDRVYLVEPPDYLPFVKLMQSCYLVLTDSGGIQEEAPSLGKPVIVLRNKTERPEGIEAGTAVLVGTDTHKIITQVRELLTNQEVYEKMSKAVNPYGTGGSSQKIVSIISKYLK